MAGLEDRLIKEGEFILTIAEFCGLPLEISAKLAQMSEPCAKGILAEIKSTERYLFAQEVLKECPSIKMDLLVNGAFHKIPQGAFVDLAMSFDLAYTRARELEQELCQAKLDYSRRAIPIPAAQRSNPARRSYRSRPSA